MILQNIDAFKIISKLKLVSKTTNHLAEENISQKKSTS